MINFRLIAQFKSMDFKDLKDYTKSLTNRIIAQIDLGAVSSDGMVVFSDGVAWVLTQPSRKQTQAEKDRFKEKLASVDTTSPDAMVAFLLEHKRGS